MTVWQLHKRTQTSIRFVLESPQRSWSWCPQQIEIFYCVSKMRDLCFMWYAYALEKKQFPAQRFVIFCPTPALRTCVSHNSLQMCYHCFRGRVETYLLIFGCHRLVVVSNSHVKYVRGVIRTRCDCRNFLSQAVNYIKAPHQKLQQLSEVIIRTWYSIYWSSRCCTCSLLAIVNSTRLLVQNDAQSCPRFYGVAIRVFEIIQSMHILCGPLRLKSLISSVSVLFSRVSRHDSVSQNRVNICV